MPVMGDVSQLDLSEAAVETGLAAAEAALRTEVYYDQAVEQWLLLETTAALNAAVGAIATSTPIADLRRVFSLMMDAALAAAKEEFSRCRGDFDEFNEAVSHAAFIGLYAVLIDQIGRNRSPVAAQQLGEDPRRRGAQGPLETTAALNAAVGAIATSTPIAPPSRVLLDEHLETTSCARLTSQAQRHSQPWHHRHAHSSWADGGLGPRCGAGGPSMPANPCVVAEHTVAPVA